MELFQAKDHYILQSGDCALWCSRKDGAMTARPGRFRPDGYRDSRWPRGGRSGADVVPVVAPLGRLRESPAPTRRHNE
ncbi:Phosphatidylinositide phosphatase SAC2 [Liparis tanakae]|uniref:Phosphatidylinositide phosphatase SAC2 n=1 Tax=Liparis tanakae TaxID=230148 RepID=A0A4Z2F0F6_9TELE|nr:Phosphatidylinositide phosphatase SAC2 [Liparis tanakae]